MSIRENIQVFHPISIEAYLDVLRDAYGLEIHPRQPDAYLIGGLPFYRPQQTEEYVEDQCLIFEETKPYLVRRWSDG